MTRKGIQNPLELPPDIASVLIPFIADVIDFAQKAAAAKWGLTDHRPYVRVNVGWTEVLTTSENSLRIIVDSSKASKMPLPSNTSIETGKRGGAYYPSIPGSACVIVPYRPIGALRSALNHLRPALFEAISKSGRRGLGRGVREGHAPDLVREIGRFVGRSLPQPQHVSQPAAAARPTSQRAEPATLMEGALRRVMANRFERNVAARDQCIAHYGVRCLVCDFSFGEAFGAIAEGFIHVHHVTPVADARVPYEINPVRDLRPVCPNCHAMLHQQDPPFTVKELRALRQRRSTDAYSVAAGAGGEFAPAVGGASAGAVCRRAAAPEPQR
ncbi:MAG: hypothetical protein ACHQ4J_10665 [Candidatus Binatia bacterium]